MSEEQKRAAKIQALKDKQAKGKGPKPSAAPAKPIEKTTSKKAQMMEKYGAKNSMTEEDKKHLDKSNASEADDALGRSVSMKIHMGAGKVDLDAAVEDSDDEAEQPGGSAKPSGIWGLISKLTGNKELDQTDIEATIAQFKEGLMAKNVAVEIADKLCDSVSEGLIGTKKGAFTTMRAKIREALEASVVKILTPKRSIDVLRDIEVANKSERRPCDPFCPTGPYHRLCPAPRPPLSVWVGDGLRPAAVARRWLWTTHRRAVTVPMRCHHFARCRGVLGGAGMSSRSLA